MIIKDSLTGLSDAKRVLVQFFRDFDSFYLIMKIGKVNVTDIRLDVVEKDSTGIFCIYC